MRVCKVCQVEKEYNYLCLNTQGRMVYKDDSGLVWHGKTCGECFRSYVRDNSGKELLTTKTCACGKEFKQKNIKQFTCCKQCYNNFLRSRR